PLHRDCVSQQGDRRGRDLGYPTANLVPAVALSCPGHVVYAGLANGLPAAVSIGVRPTFNTGRGELIEVFILDFDGDLYGSEMCVQFIRRLRGERRFASADALIAQMHRDVEQARQSLAKVALP